MDDCSFNFHNYDAIFVKCKISITKKKSIIFLNSKKLGQSCILHCHLIMSRFIPKKKHFKSAST